MFVFPANDEGYRKRKRAHKACEQCKRRRKRCEPPFKNHERCAPCMKENIPCSLVPATTGDIGDRDRSPIDDLEDTRTVTERVVQAALARVSNPPNIATINIKPAESTSVTNGHRKSSSSSTSASAAATAAAAVAPVASSTAATFDDTVATPAAHSTSTSTARTKRSTSSLSSSMTNGIKPAERTATNGSGDSTRFTGDGELDPASVLLTLRNLEKDRVGVWVKGGSGHQPLNQHLVAYLDSLHAFDLPPRQDREGLLNVYFKYVHPLLPLFDKGTFLAQHARDECPTLLLHAVQLAACRHSSARRFIHLRSPRHFASVTAAKIRALIYADIERDKVTVVRALALLSLHSEGSDGLEKSGSDLEQAFHYAHFLGFHHERRSHPDEAPIRRLWWSLWCLDRMSACVCARPVISRLDDVGVSGLGSNEEAWLGKLYEVCQVLDRVIMMYRPLGSTLPPEVDLEVTYGGPSPLASFLQLVRHCACILAHKRAPESPENNASILLHSTTEILHIVRTQPQLPPFPVVPYAVSLTLTVYLRLYPSPEARTGWHESCAVLDDLAKTWWVAEAMGGMARSVFRKLEEDQANRQGVEDAMTAAAWTGFSAAPSTTITTTATTTTTTAAGASAGAAAPIRSRPFPTKASRAGSVTKKEPKPRMPQTKLSGKLRPLPSSSSSSSDTYPTSMSTAPSPIRGSSGSSTLASTSVSHSPIPPPPPPPPTAMTAATPSLETQFLEMFSDLPNPTSFLDQALMLDDFAGLSDLWLPDVQFEETVAVTTGSSAPAVTTTATTTATASVNASASANANLQTPFAIPSFPSNDRN
ncbi:fungal-specific transcription factor domain-containing protein [Lipomyces kononenkoae]|uniref:Fungal-specific transcription factor domain-containing protein n=1 Tax=Lipomyces kononenkoae TaxID=34357 RepID=A0ACC3TAF8_LIPKO